MAEIETKVTFGWQGGKATGEKLEGVAFQFCKVATVALICGRYTLIVASALAAILYLAAFFKGKRDTRCWARKPLLIAIFWIVVCAVSIYLLLRPAS